MTETMMQENERLNETMTLADAVARVLASDQPGVVTGYVTAEEQLETAAVLSEAGASDALVVRAMAALAEAVKTPQRNSALWASGWAAAAELLSAEKNRDDARITAAYVTALLHCDERRRKTRVHTAVLNWEEAAADAGAVWRLVTLLKADAARFELPEAERAADALRAALLREFPCWWVVTLAETAAGHAMLPDIFRYYDIDAVVKAKGVWWVKIRNAEEERVLTSIAAHWAGGVTVKRFPGWPDEGSLPAKRPVTRVEWVKRRRLIMTSDADPCREWFEAREVEPAFESEDEDRLYERAVKRVKASGRTSTSFLQRSLGIGYRQTSALMARMETAGVVSPMDTAGKRRVL